MGETDRIIKTAGFDLNPGLPRQRKKIKDVLDVHLTLIHLQMRKGFVFLKQLWVNHPVGQIDGVLIQWI